MRTSVVGPVHGLYVASYACPVGELGDRFVGYFRLYAHRAACFCDGDSLDGGVTPAAYPSPEEALHQAVLLALDPARQAGAAGAAHLPAAPRPRAACRCAAN